MERKQRFALLCIIRKNRVNSKELCPVYLRITVDGKRTEMVTNVNVPLEKWNATKGRLKGLTEEIRRINAMIDRFEHRAREIYNQFFLEGKLLSADLIKDELTGKVHKKRTLLALFDERLEDMRRLENHAYSKGTIKNWEVTRGHLEQFMKEQYSLSDLPFKQLEYSFIADLEWFARAKWGCGTNATLKHIERMRKIIKIAIIRGWLNKDPFLAFSVKKESSHRTFLTRDEMQQIENKTFYTERLERVRDVFIFSCYTGLAYVDIEQLTGENMVNGIDGKNWIYTFRQKTKTKSNIPLLPNALAIINKYNPEGIVRLSDKLLPVITNIKTNEYLKEIAIICNIHKNLTFHMARHTFATTVTLSNGVPIETVSNMLGHSKITTTQIYAKVLEDKVSKDMLQLESRISSWVK